VKCLKKHSEALKETIARHSNLQSLQYFSSLHTDYNWPSQLSTIADCKCTRPLKKVYQKVGGPF